MDKLIAQGMEILDDGKRKEIYNQVQKTVMTEAPWGFLVYPKYALGRKKALKGFTYYTSNNLRFQDFSRA